MSTALPTDLGAAFQSVVDTAAKESDVQQFLAAYPQIITAHYHALGSAIFPQLPMGNDFRADFAFIEATSTGTYLRLIEIEDPTEPLFLANDEFSQPLNHAFTQITDWAGWVGRNQKYLNDIFEALEAEYGFSPNGFLLPQCLLIMGRRAELSNKRRQDRLQARVNQLARNLEFRTYDGFINDMPLSLRQDVTNKGCIQCYRYAGGRWRTGP